jgi:hypothetical protein
MYGLLLFYGSFLWTNEQSAGWHMPTRLHMLYRIALLPMPGYAAS